MNVSISLIMPAATIIATALAAFSLYRTGALKLVTDERNIYREKSERLEIENSFFKKKIEEIERRLERYELIFQGRDPETLAAFDRFAEKLETFIGILETRCLRITPDYNVTPAAPRPKPIKTGLDKAVG